MSGHRWTMLERKGTGLTESEIQAGWHFCNEWDGLLVGPGMIEQEACTCFSKEKV